MRDRQIVLVLVLLLFVVLCFSFVGLLARLREKEVKTRPSHFTVIFIFCLLLDFRGCLDSLKDVSASRLSRLNLLPFMDIVYFLFDLSALVLDLAFALFVADFAKFKRDASLVYLLKILVKGVPICRRFEAS